MVSCAVLDFFLDIDTITANQSLIKYQYRDYSFSLALYAEMKPGPLKL